MAKDRLHARRIPVSDNLRAIDSLDKPDYADSFVITSDATTGRSAEVWMRRVFEGAPPALRWCMLAGWRLALRFRPGPRRSPQHILGWKIVNSMSDVVILERCSALVTAHLLLQATEARLVWATFVRYNHRAARRVWTVVGLIHRRIVPYILTNAVSPPSQ